MNESLVKAKINLGALKDNFSFLKSRSSNAKILAVIKANAYGHGLERIAECLHQADALAVARIEEARALRQSGIKSRLVLLEGVFSLEDFHEALDLELEVVVHNDLQLSLIESFDCAKLEKPNCKIWLKINTGMNRLGFMPDQLETVLEKIKSYSWVGIESYMTHLACADSGELKDINKPLALFESLVANKNLGSEKLSVANSAALLHFPQTHKDWVRPGIALYGSSPAKDVVKELKPVMTLSSKVLSVFSLKAGEAVGYGASWIAPEDTNIAVVGIGYGDGYPRHAANGTPVLINGEQRSLVGRVSMDMITVDLGAHHDVQIGDRAVLWGEDENGEILSIDLIANHADTISYELLCGITQRVEKLYID